MQSFEQWLKTNHPDQYDENWKKWLAAGALGAGLGVGGMHGYQQMQKTQAPVPQDVRSVTSPDAAKFLQDEPVQQVTSPDAAKFLQDEPARGVASPDTAPGSRARDWKRRAEQELRKRYGTGGLEDKTVVSPDAAKFLP
jgi:hypothetical protein